MSKIVDEAKARIRDTISQMTAGVPINKVDVEKLNTGLRTSLDSFCAKKRKEVLDKLKSKQE